MTGVLYAGFVPLKDVLGMKVSQHLMILIKSHPVRLQFEEDGCLKCTYL